MQLSAIFDIDTSVDGEAEKVRKELLELKKISGMSGEFSFNNHRFRIMDIGVRVAFTSLVGDPWRQFVGLVTPEVRIMDSGSDCFPQPGLYMDGQTVYAAVTQEVKARILAGGDMRGAQDEESERMVVAYSRTWSLSLSAPSFEDALTKYRDIRCGTAVVLPYTDTMPDDKKTRAEVLPCA